jgi:predicted glycoside hydrolase/deacetylase ChbG (UPF0249 family)
LRTAKRLIVNADDLGFTSDVNEGILEAHRNGIVTAATIMANGAALEHAVRLAMENPTLDLGAHLVLIGGYSVARPGRSLPPTPAALVRALARRRFDPYAECAAQIERLLSAGLRLSHLDTHKHAHLLPPVAAAVGRVAQEFGIGWVRRPLDVPLAGWLARRRLRQWGCRMTNQLLGFAETGRLDLSRLLALLRRLPEGTSELLCHPGHCGTELLGAPTRLKESRVRELAALTAPEVRRALEDLGIELTGFRALA